ncbi:MAG: hypothetical protein E4H01_05505 [Lysobacterales bacterium]|nr:MAG: hypothetical protein E4H01_05505 [Xanthomonadales bacterium]
MQVTHEELWQKMVEHDDAITEMGESVRAINAKLDPIVKSLRSIALAFKGLLALGAGSAAMVAIIELGKAFG